MIREHKTFTVLLICAFACMIFFTSCSRTAKHEPAQPATELPSRAPAQAEEKIERTPIEVKESWQESQMKEEVPEATSIDELNLRKVLKTVYFDFDKYDLREDTVATLKENAQWLRENPSFDILLEGHCDERGTIEYNLELGAKRAAAVKNYLATIGLEVSRFKTMSYGEEKPVDLGHDEDAWAKNRRVEFIIEK